MSSEILNFFIFFVGSLPVLHLFCLYIYIETEIAIESFPLPSYCTSSPVAVSWQLASILRRESSLHESLFGESL
jgi:hypothetical protein